MIGDNAAPRTIDEYIAGFSPDVQAILQEVRAAIRAAAPEAVETISYAMPTFDLLGRHLVHFAAYKGHTGVYGEPRGPESLLRELAPYQTGKGTLRFALDRPVPLDLLRRIVEQRVVENQAWAADRAGSKRRRPRQGAYG